MMRSRAKIIRITTVPLSFEKLLEGQLAYMSEYYEVIAVSSDKERLERYGKKEGVRTCCINLTRKITPWKDIRAVLKLRRYLKAERPEIVHTHTPKAGIVGMLAAYLAGVPIRMHTVAGLPLLEATGLKRRILNFVERLTYKYATHVYPNSYGLKDIITKNGFIRSEKLKVLGNGSSNGIDLDYFKPGVTQPEQLEKIRIDILPEDRELVFLFVGRIVKDKGIEELVKAFKQLKAKHDKIKLILVGPFEEELDPLSVDVYSEINRNPSIITTGYQADVRPYFELADIFVFPSYREGFPNVVLQAAAMGLPSIVSDINGCNEIIAHEENGLICQVKDREDLKSAMEKLILSPDIRSKLKSAARPSIEKKYERQQLWNLLREEYELLLNQL